MENRFKILQTTFLINPKNCQRHLKFAKVAKFRLIWSREMIMKEDYFYKVPNYICCTSKLVVRL